MLWPILIYAAGVIATAVGMLVVSHFLGERHRERATGQPYEGGVLSQGSAHVRLSVKYHVIAMFFVVFDVEAVFIFLWAVSARETGWAGYFEMLIFIGVLAATLAYLWGIGALDWAKVRRHAGIGGQE
jgi:NADH-quinone oxidoreductase subunit A